MPKKYSLFIPNAKPSGTPLEVFAPYNNEHIATVECATEEGIDKALATAHSLQQHRSTWLPTEQRLKILEKAAQIIESRAEELAVEAAREGGKPLIDSRVEIARGIDGLRICIEVMRTEQGSVIPMGVNAASQGRIAMTRREPIGVVVAVSAFNHPFNLIIHQVAPAIAVGCPVIVKPAGVTPLSCLHIVEILREAGLPDEWCQVATLNDNKLAEKLATDPRVHFFSFIGSARVGWMLRSKLAPGTRCALEHGGAAPVIFEADADMKRALPLLAKGGFYHAGQVCVSVQRIFAHKSVAEDLAKMLADQAKKLKIGDPTDAHTEVGPLIRASEVDRVESWVNEAIDGGAKCLSGGKRISDSCYEATVLYNPPLKSKVMKEEVFGPVVCVSPFDDRDQAIRLANALPWSFQAAVFTQDIDVAMASYSHLDASAVMINDHTAFRVDWMPFAGLRHSGLGVGGIPHTMRDMQIEKMLVIKSNGLL